MSNYLSHKILREAALNEVGELNLENAYDVSNINFTKGNLFIRKVKTDVGTLTINFQDATGNEKVLKNNAQLQKLKIFNVSYSINQNNFQAEKTNYKELMKILSTVFLIVEKFAKEVKFDVLLIAGNNPFNKNIGIKQALYGAIIEKNIEKIEKFNEFNEILVNGEKTYMVW